MKAIIKIFLILWITSLCGIFAQDTTSVKPQNPDEAKKQMRVRGFVDENGDGFNDNAPDDDGDGIPNGLDPDYIKNKNKQKYIDLDGDGINDYVQNRRGKNSRSKKGENSVEPQSSTNQQVEQKTNVNRAQQKRKGRGK